MPYENHQAYFVARSKKRDRCPAKSSSNPWPKRSQRLRRRHPFCSALVANGEESLLMRCSPLTTAQVARSLFTSCGHRMPPAMLPSIVYIHRAGWVVGSKRTHDRLMRALAVGAEAVVVFPEYRLPPEAKYLTAIKGCYFRCKLLAPMDKRAVSNASSRAT
jgi:acetyl esterase/lipase